MTNDPDQRPISALLADAFQLLANLARGEIALVRAEVRQKIRSAGMGLCLILIAFLFAATALNTLSGALVAAIVAAGLPPAWAMLAVGAGLALIALICAVKGRNALRPSNLYPSRSVQSIRRAAKTLKELMTNDPTQ